MGHFPVLMLYLIISKSNGGAEMKLKVKAEIKTDSDGRLVVDTTVLFPKVDRTDLMGFIMKPAKCVLAKRLATAINAGVVFENPTIETDVDGKTFVSSDMNVMGRHLNADLLRLGY